MRSQHPSKFSEYQNIEGTDERLALFESVDVPSLNTLHAHGVDEKKPLCFLINKSIVETIVSDMLIQPDDVDGVAQT